ncbi:MAG: bifunctional nicotinamidase/pyrazinamidase [Treponema sp.]|jgi:nicotinamidase/pyrazinamidase|nr:bifunctional nicotinamidase/pyrazinamidase [Treponema sp.]
MKLNCAETLLLIIDAQNDFCPAYYSKSGQVCPGGALAVNEGGAVIPPLNALSSLLAIRGGRVALTQDWHPAGHISFASSHQGKNPGNIIDTTLVEGQYLWPDHCVQGAWGASFHDDLDPKPASLIIRKGTRSNLDSYSAFFENDRKTPTGLEGWIKSLNITTVIMGGLATDYCVFYSAMDSIKLGLNTIIASDAIRGVGIPEGSVEKAVSDMKNAGCGFITSDELFEDMR